MPSAAELQRESIEESLGLEEIDPLTYRSTRLWIPINARYVEASMQHPYRISDLLLPLSEVDSVDRSSV